MVILLDPGVEPGGDLVSAMVEALADPTVAVAGPFGLVSPDLRRFEAPPEGATDAVAIEADALAFRRSDFVGRGPLDERFALRHHLDVLVEPRPPGPEGRRTGRAPASRGPAERGARGPP